MNERKEGPLERKFWIALSVLTFGPIAIGLVAYILGGRDAISATAPIFFFGMTMVGVLMVGFGLWDLTQRKVDWFALIGGGAWLFFFGRTFLRMVGVDL